MKKYIYALLISSLSLGSSSLLAQGFYGQTTYPHIDGGSKLSTAFAAKLHVNNPGYLMGGYRPFCGPNSSNFIIDRTDSGGIISNNSWSFQKSYQLFAYPSNECLNEPVRVNNCAGISIIETNAPGLPLFNANPTVRYALTGAFNNGCFFSLLDISGNPVFSTSFIFPLPQNFNVTKPNIIECASAKGNYIVTGSVDKTMYAFRINTSGVVLWSHFYPIAGAPLDMIESPYGSLAGNELVVVGKTELNAAFDGVDCFIMTLNEQNGAVNSFKRINTLSSVPLLGPTTSYFTTIALAPNCGPGTPDKGFIIGGYCDPRNLAQKNRSFFIRTDTNLNYAHVPNVFKSNFDPDAGEIADIQVRKRPNSDTSDFYALINSNIVGSIVVKFAASWHLYGPPSPFYETFYNVPGRLTEPCALDFIDAPNAPDKGLKVFASMGNLIPAGHYLANGYFSLETGCNPIGTINLSNVVSLNYTNQITPFGSLSTCASIILVPDNSPGFHQVCGPYAYIAGGSNARTIASSEPLSSTELIKTEVYPNPSNGLTNLNLELVEKSYVKLELCNAIGQIVANIEDGVFEAGTHAVEFNLKNLSLDAGIYFVRNTVNHKTSTVKLIYATN